MEEKGKIEEIVKELQDKNKEALKGFSTKEDFENHQKSIDELTQKLNEIGTSVKGVTTETLKEITDLYKKQNDILIAQGGEITALKEKGLVNRDNTVNRDNIKILLHKFFVEHKMVKERNEDGKIIKYIDAAVGVNKGSTFKNVKASNILKAGEPVFVYNDPSGAQSVFNDAIPYSLLPGVEKIPLSADDHLLDVFGATNMTSGENMRLYVYENEELNAELVLEGKSPSANSRLEKNSKDFKVFNYRATAVLSDETLRSVNDLVDELSIQLEDDLKQALDVQLITTGGDNSATPYGILNPTYSATLFNPLLFEGKGGSNANIVSVFEYSRLQARLNKYIVNSIIANPLTYSEINELRDADANSIMDRRLGFNQLGVIASILGMRNYETLEMPENQLLVYDVRKQALKVREGINMSWGHENTQFSEGEITMKIGMAAAYGQRRKASAIHCDDISTAISILGATAAESLVRVQAYATGSDATACTIATLVNTGATDVIAANLAAYKVAIAAEASIASLAALQTVIDTVNAA